MGAARAATDMSCRIARRDGVGHWCVKENRGEMSTDGRVLARREALGDDCGKNDAQWMLVRVEKEEEVVVAAEVEVVSVGGWQAVVVAVMRGGGRDWQWGGRGKLGRARMWYGHGKSNRR